MLKSTMDAAKRDAPAIEQRDEAKKKLAAKALKKVKESSTPSYNDVMKAFSQRLVKKEHAVKDKLMPKETLAKVGVVQRGKLEAAIKRKVEASLEKGNSALAAERAQLAKQFSGSNSLFGKAEKSELASLRDKRHVQLAEVSGDATQGSSWTL